VGLKNDGRKSELGKDVETNEQVEQYRLARFYQVEKVKDNVFRPTHTNFGSVFTFVKLTKKPDTEVR
jgi:hypothetical protein